MASVSEAIGMALPGSASPPAVDSERMDMGYATGKALMNLIARGIIPTPWLAEPTPFPANARFVPDPRS